jgi:DNA mismatch repair protein MutS
MGDHRETPAMRQYHRFKKQHPDCLLLFRMGDFYEIFDEDAKTASKAVGLALTERTKGVPMAGMPHHQLEPYVRKLIGQGFRVAVADQIQDPKDAKGIVERAVTRVFTPGTLIDDDLLADGATPCLAAVSDRLTEQGQFAVAAIDASTGMFVLFSVPVGELAEALLRRSVGEVLFCEQSSLLPQIEEAVRASGASATPRPAWHFRKDEAHEALADVFSVSGFGGFGIDDDDVGLLAAGAAVRYLRETQTPAANVANTNSQQQRASLSHLRAPRRENDEGVCVLDATSLRALEVERTIRSGDVEGSLLGVIIGRSGCRTAMGKRLIGAWLRRPSSTMGVIEARQRCVSVLVEDRTLAGVLAQALEPVQDVSRIAARIALGRASPRDLVGLGGSLAMVRALSDAAGGAEAFAVQRAALGEVALKLEPLAKEIGRTCVERPPAHLREGGLVRDGVDAQLDEARSLQRDAGAWLADYQAKLIEEHDLPNLKVGFNRVFGYFIELPARQADRAPSVFTRKQTLKNAERYITPQLKEYEDKVTTAESRAIERERIIFDRLCAQAAKLIPSIHRFADVVAQLDALLCFADKAAQRGWVKPEMVEEPILEIEAGRHAVLDELLGDSFVPNDVSLMPRVEGSAPLALITGPNMAGKSTFIRQTALLVLLAHAGSFIPATRARIGLTDRIFTRVGADDALHSGQSTFMVEMTETASILHNATGCSLIVLDEIGRGTSTLDGLSLAWAIVEFLSRGSGESGGVQNSEQDTANSKDSSNKAKTDNAATGHGPRTLFATHYHELTQLEEQLPGRVKNLHVTVREWGDEIIFVHRIKPGRSDQSYGVHVAKLAGIPDAVTDRAREVLSSLAVHQHGSGEVAGAAAPADSADVSNGPSAIDSSGSHVVAPPAAHVAPPTDAQFSLFNQPMPHPAVDELKEIKLESITPMEAFDELRRLKEMAQE